jgi:RNA-directed DNA polymerase
MWHQWKKPKARYRNMMALGVRRDLAWQWSYSSKKTWRMSGSPPLHRALGNAYWRAQGLVSLVELQRLRHS